MTERAVVFGQAVEAYDRLRPAYPMAAIEHVLGLTTAHTAVEIGAGTGIATAGFAGAGLRITCVEPDPTMAAALESRRLPGVDVVISRFEEWPGPEVRCDLVFAAQSWHWIDGGVGYPKVLGMLAPGGVVALMWNVHVDRYGAFSSVYEEHAPELLAEADARIARRDSDVWLGELRDAGFEDVGLFTHTWSASMPAADVASLYSTFSDHITLDPSRRERLLTGLVELIDRAGGRVDIAYRTQVFTGRSPS
jgi:trans-aconitate methyltransferase